MRGLAVFPCSARDKRPLVPHGFKSASSDPAVIARWEREYPGCLWGAPVPAGVHVVDVDVHHGGDESLARIEAEHGALPATRTTRTRSGGRHLWFATDVELRQTAGVLGAGLDTRASGKGYCIIPPSEGYSWLDDGPIAPAPAWLVALLVPPKPTAQARPVETFGDRNRLSRYAEAALLAECDTVRRCPIGAGLRNKTLHKAACRLGQLVGAGILDKWSAAQALNAATSLPTKEAEATILSGLNWGLNNPRAVAS